MNFLYRYPGNTSKQARIVPLSGRRPREAKYLDWMRSPANAQRKRVLSVHFDMIKWGARAGKIFVTPAYTPEDFNATLIGGKCLIYLAGEEGLEPPTPGFGDRCSNQIELHSYAGRMCSVKPERKSSF